MPFTFEIDTVANVIHETWTGTVDLAQMKDSCLREWAHRDYKRRMHMISDFRQANSSIEATDVVQFALWFGDKDPPARHAIVVGRESGFGFAKMFGLMSDAAKHSANSTQVFYSLSAAHEWPGLAPKS
jgi:hypothetical protein